MKNFKCICNLGACTCQEFGALGMWYYAILPSIKSDLTRHEICKPYNSKYGDNMYDMAVKVGVYDLIKIASYVRLASISERMLKEIYLSQKIGVKIGRGDFQRYKFKSNSIYSRYLEIEIDLDSFTRISEFQKFLQFRHMYAHNSGYVDEGFIKNMKEIDDSVKFDIDHYYPKELDELNSRISLIDELIKYIVEQISQKNVNSS